MAQEKDIIDHFVTVADSVPIPVVIYNNPMTTGIDLSLKIIETLTTHTNIAGIKELDVSFQNKNACPKL